MQIHEQARLYLVRGRVQGVGFRWFVERVARELGLTGYVKNLDDGRVEVYAVGPPNRLAALEGLLWKGPDYADVRGVEASDAPLRGKTSLASFRIEPSW